MSFWTRTFKPIGKVEPHVVHYEPFQVARHAQWLQGGRVVARLERGTTSMSVVLVTVRKGRASHTTIYAVDGAHAKVLLTSKSARLTVELMLVLEPLVRDLFGYPVNLHKDEMVVVRCGDSS